MWGHVSPPYAQRVARPSVPPQLEGMLKNREALKGHVWEAFQSAGNGATGLNKQQLRVFVQRFTAAIEAPAIFSQIDDQHCRFDQNGNGLLEVDELYKFAFFNVARFWRKHSGAAATQNIPRKTLQQAGFRVTKELGAGTQGGAKLAISPQGQEVCIKQISKMSAQQVGMAQLQDEYLCQRLTAADHVLKMLEIFQDAHNFYMVSEPYLGGDLTTLTKKARQQKISMNESWWKAIFRQCLEALGHLHGHAMMHCDIKEPNLMIKAADFREPHIVLIDFGIARAMADNVSQTCGTPGYIPPETWDTGKWFPKGDIFSLGVVIVQLMANKLPPLGARTPWTKGGIFLEGCATFPEIQHATKTRQPPYRLMQPQSQGCIRLVQACLAKRMKGRPTSTQALADPWVH